MLQSSLAVLKQNLQKEEELVNNYKIAKNVIK